MDTPKGCPFEVWISYEAVLGRATDTQLLQSVRESGKLNNLLIIPQQQALLKDTWVLPLKEPLHSCVTLCGLLSLSGP